ncbi:MAG: DUF3431 domain-containing protein [Verrucomicrobia bacterium]|nr:DUF3431 domain-containing protein [Verrucomicrobiota bacterium]
MNRPSGPVDLEVVVCRCGETLDWLRNLPQGVRITVYDKTPPPASRWAEAVPLPNVGREAHAWLHHLVERYDSLAEWTLFAQGRPFDHVPEMHRVVRRLAAGEIPPEDFLWLGFLWETDDARGRPTFVHWTKNPERRELDLKGFFHALWNEPAPDKVRYVGGGQFVLGRPAALRRTREFFQKARSLAEKFPDAAHAFERTWDRVFLAPPLDPSLFGPSGYRLLKPVKPKPERSGRPDPT